MTATTVTVDLGKSTRKGMHSLRHGLSGWRLGDYVFDPGPAVHHEVTETAEGWRDVLTTLDQFAAEMGDNRWNEWPDRAATLRRLLDAADPDGGWLTVQAVDQ